MKTRLIPFTGVDTRHTKRKRRIARCTHQVQYAETVKNLKYIAKRKALAERATVELGVQCWG